MALRSLLFILVALVAEVLASWRIWGGAPTDTLRVAYSGFWSYEVGRLLCWTILSAVFLTAGLIASRVSSRRARTDPGHRSALLLFGTAQLLALSLEISTSVVYWNAQSSRPTRDLYSSIWHWHRIPQLSDQGWPSLKGYIGDHALAWATVLLIAEALVWVVFRKGETKRSV